MECIAYSDFLVVALTCVDVIFITSLKVGIAASLIGAVVAELSLSQDGGLGARMLVGSYYGQTIQIWSALIVAATLAALMVAVIGVVQTVALKKMGMAS